MTHRLRFLLCCMVIPVAFFGGLVVLIALGANPMEAFLGSLVMATAATLVPAISFALSILEGVDAAELTAERLRQPGRSPYKQ